MWIWKKRGRARDAEMNRGSQWHYRDLGYREPQWTSPPQRYFGPSWTREAGYGFEGKSFEGKTEGRQAA
jgi:hypothetical protein